MRSTRWRCHEKPYLVIDRCEDSIIGAKPDRVFKWSDYWLPMVYAWKRGDEWLYIGKSDKGLRRIFSHDVIGIKDAVRADDIIMVWFCDYDKIGGLEKRLIKKYQPKYNIMSK